MNTAASSCRVSPAKRRSNWPQSPTGRDPVPRERPAKACQGNPEDRAPARSPARQRSSGARASAASSASRERSSGARNGAGRLSESSQSSHKEKRHSTTSRRKSGQSATQSSVSTSACTSCTTSVPTSAAVSRASSPPISTAVSRVPSTPASAAASRAPSPPRSPVMSWTALSNPQPVASSRPGPVVRVNPPTEPPPASSASDTPTSTVINWFNLPEHDIEGTEDDSESPMQESLPADSQIVPLCAPRDSPAERLDKALMLESLWPPHSSRSSTAESPCVSLPSMSILVAGEGNVHRMTSDGQRTSPSPPSVASGASVQSFVYAPRDGMEDLSEASEFEEVATDDISDAMTSSVEKPSHQLEKDLARTVEGGSQVASPSRSPRRRYSSKPKVSIVNVATEVPTERSPGKETADTFKDVPDAPEGCGQKMDRLSPPASPTIHCNPWGAVSRVRIVSIGTEVKTARSPGPPIMVEGVTAPRVAAKFCGTVGPPRENKEVGGVHCDASARSGSVRKVTISPSISPLRVGLGSIRVHSKVVLDGGVRCSPACSPAGSRAGSPAPVRLSSQAEATVYCRSHVGSPAGSRAGSPVPAAVQVSACKTDAPQVQEQLQHTVRRVSRSSAPRPPVLPAGPMGPARSPRWAFNQAEDNRGMLGHPAPLCLAAGSSPSNITSVAKQQVVAISGLTTARTAVGIAKAASLQMPVCPSVGVPQGPPPQAPPIIHAPNPNEPQ